MGVSGCGKTTIGARLASQFQIPYYDADDFHPPSNINKMKDGIPLNDEDRMPWLEMLSKNIEIWHAKGDAILSCSALKESYREILTSKINDVIWVYLKGSFELITSRIEKREGHYMKSDLLQSQFDTLEEPAYAITIDIDKPIDTILTNIISKLKPMRKSEFGLIGLGVMGKSLSLNIAEKGFNLSVYNRSDENEAHIVTDFLEDNPSIENMLGFQDIKAFVESLERPRRIFIMVKAGTVVDAVIEQLLPYLSKNDTIIDGGNSHYKDTQKRFGYLKEKGLNFIGCGVSGGEAGARKGPSIMPGGTLDSYKIVAPILESIAAKDANNNPCCSFIGPGGAGHFVKMIHNGIEYAEMQLLAEVYSLLALSMSNTEIATVFDSWNKTNASSYLLEITSDILSKKVGENYIVDTILDKAGNKGTGCWSSKTALDLGVPTTMMTSAVFARYISSLKEKRTLLSKQLDPIVKSAEKPDVAVLKQAYHFARTVNHHQGFELIQQASIAYHWNLNLSEIARIWTNGCIIRSQFMTDAISYFKTHTDLLSNDIIFNSLKHGEPAISDVLRLSLSNRIPLDAFYSAYNYWLGMTTERLSAHIIQAQRDYFGAHTYLRNDAPADQFFHTNWNAL